MMMMMMMRVGSYGDDGKGIVLAEVRQGWHVCGRRGAEQGTTRRSSETLLETSSDHSRRRT